MQFNAEFFTGTIENCITELLVGRQITISGDTFYLTKDHQINSISSYTGIVKAVTFAAKSGNVFYNIAFEDGYAATDIRGTCKISTRDMPLREIVKEVRVEVPVDVVKEVRVEVPVEVVKEVVSEVDRSPKMFVSASDIVLVKTVGDKVQVEIPFIDTVGKLDEVETILSELEEGIFLSSQPFYDKKDDIVVLNINLSKMPASRFKVILRRELDSGKVERVFTVIPEK